jgi:hypothetical protein
MEILSDNNRYTKEQAEDEAARLQKLITWGYAKDINEAEHIDSIWSEIDAKAFISPAEYRAEREQAMAEFYHHCYACRKPLKPIDGSPFDRCHYQYWDVLPIKVSGGFGMYLDPPVVWEDREKHLYQDEKDKAQKGIIDPYEILICKECADNLCEIAPWLGDWLKYNCANEKTGDCGDCDDCCTGCRGKNHETWCHNDDCEYPKQNKA